MHWYILITCLQKKGARFWRTALVNKHLFNNYNNKLCKMGQCENGYVLRLKAVYSNVLLLYKAGT